jgi:sarcosine oxidase
MIVVELEVAVIGAGIVGLAATDAIARRGVGVRCFDAAVPGQAQSGGLTRIFRHRHDDERLIDLAVKARQGWQRWEERSGRRLLASHGVLFAGLGESDGSGLARHNVPYRVVDGQELPAALGVVAPMNAPVLVDELGGAIRARRAVEILQCWVGGHLERAEVLGVAGQPGGNGAWVQTGHGLYAARHVLVCAGAGTRRLAAGLGLDVPVSYALHARPTFRLREDLSEAALPCWVDHSGEHGEEVYGSPVGSSGRYAVGLSGADDSLPLGAGAELPPGADMDKFVRRVASYVTKAMPGLEPEVESVRLCLSTRLPGWDDGFSTWQTDGVTVFAGHNLFKFAPVLGELLADAAIDGAVADVLNNVATG